MGRTAQDVCSDLEAFELGPTEAHSMSRLYEILDGVRELPDHALLVTPLFAFLERFPDAELGSPGPIVHALEAIAPFSKQLAESLLRQPTLHTITMVQRILNSPITPSDRTFWLAQLRKVPTHARSSSMTKAISAEILKEYAA